MFKRNKSIVLDCYTDNVYAYNFAKINYGHHYIPDWFKEMPKRKFGYMPTIKKCPGIVSYYKQSIVIPMWCDVRLKLPSLSDRVPANGNFKEFIDATTSHNKIDFSSLSIPISNPESNCLRMLSECPPRPKVPST